MNASLVLLIAAYVVAPATLLRIHRSWGTLAAVLALWLPIEFGVFTRAGLNPIIAITIGMATCLLTFHSRKDVFDLRTAFNPRTIEPKRATVAFLAFAVIAIPLGLAIGFIRPVFDAAELPGVPLMLVIIYCFNALPEEILFRGLIQGLLENNMASRTIALSVAAMIFGLSHLNNGPPVPNYRYALMASIAGIFYGLAWRSRRNVLTSAITHTLVNTGWNLFFR